ncbi:hypothetical protein TNCV_538131 [Trichonephila clavipes]|nr:hypothetical protein TNCV_538131 [Trichonephila clavipes]
MLYVVWNNSGINGIQGTTSILLFDFEKRIIIRCYRNDRPLALSEDYSKSMADALFLVSWSAQSPDLSTSENLWDEVKWNIR